MAAPAASHAAGVGGYQVRLPAVAKAGELTPFQPCTFNGLPARGTDAALCATLVVAENPKTPNGRLLALPLVKLPALKAEKPDALFYLRAGPGATNLSYRVNARGVFENFDVYMLGYRGVDDPNPLKCPELAKPLTVPHPLSEAAAPAITEAARQCAARLTASGTDLPQYSMVNVVEDHEAVRKALGLARLNLISESYGTRLAQYYARLHPKSVRRSIMVAANPPGHLRWYPETTNELIGEWSKLCAADAKCSARTPDLKKSILTTLARDDHSFNGKPVDMDRVRVGAFVMLRRKSSAVMLFDAVLAAEKGDASGLARLSTLYDAAFVTPAWGDAASKVGGELMPKDERAFREERRSTPTSFGSPLDLLHQALAKGWPLQPFPKGFDKVVKDTTPTLLVSGNLDSTAPPRFARDELLPYLPNGRLVILRNRSHEDWADEQLPALDRLLVRFLKDGVVDDSGFVTTPAPFK